MGAYYVNKLCHLAQHDKAFRERLKTDPTHAVGELDLTGEEKDALLSGDVARLYQLGAHPYLLGHLTRYGLFGLTRESYSQRMKTLLPAGS